MAKFFSFSFFLFLLVAGKSQNLVPNPSFEEHSGCPKTTAQLNFCDGWTSFGNSPDYFHECSDFMGVPSNILGFQEAREGLAYSGITCFSTANSNYREHLGVELNNPMEIGSTYYASFWISKSDLLSTRLACSNQGIRFSTVPFTNGNGTPISNWDHIHNYEVLTDTIEWVQIKGAFVADSNYNYIVVGNFYDDNNTDTVHMDSVAFTEAYYYIDDVRLSLDSNYAFETGIFHASIQYDLKVYPNPFDASIHVLCPIEISRVEIMSISGELVLEEDFNERNLRISTSDLYPGCYLIRVTFRNGCCQTRIIFKM